MHEDVHHVDGDESYVNVHVDVDVVREEQGVHVEDDVNDYEDETSLRKKKYLVEVKRRNYCYYYLMKK